MVPRVVETTDTGGSRQTVVSRAEESFSKRTYKMKKICGAVEVGRSREAQSLLLSHLQERCVSVDTWGARNSAALLWLETFLQEPASSS